MSLDVASRFAPADTLAVALLSLDQPQGGDGAHDLSHILRVWQNVQTLRQGEGGDHRVLVAATILHDCVNLPKDDPKRSDASRLSGEKAARILAELGWLAKDIDQVSHAIQAHSFSAEIVPRTLEAKILQDADRLDALGHIGIARCFVVTGQLERAIYDPQDPAAQARPLDDGTYALDHFYTKLLKLADGFQTPTGQRLARARHAVMETFVAGLLSEVAP
ncbi:MAG: HD domain-containing protein [Sulfitobacter sp.]